MSRLLAVKQMGIKETPHIPVFQKLLADSLNYSILGWFFFAKRDVMNHVWGSYRKAPLYLSILYLSLMLA